MARTSGVILTALLLALLTVGAASSAQAKRYSAIDVEAYYFYNVDRGDDVERGIAGDFEWRARYRMRTIAVFDGVRVTTPGNLSVVAANLTVRDARKKRVLVNREWRVVPYCDGWDPPEDLQGERSNYVSAPDASAAIGSSARLTVKPGNTARFKLKYCSESETLNTHGLPAGPRFSLPAPGKARFRGTNAFSIFCTDSLSHGAEHGVESFAGHVHIKVRVRPFPTSALGDRKELLRRMVGKEFTATLKQDSKGGKACL